MQDFLTKLNGWAKVIVVVFSCGVLYAKIDNMDKNLTHVIQTHERYDAWMGNHETRITVLESQVVDLKKGAK